MKKYRVKLEYVVEARNEWNALGAVAHYIETDEDEGILEKKEEVEEIEE